MELFQTYCVFYVYFYLLDELKKNNWEMLETHADAKQALIYVFNVLTEKTKENLNKSFIIMENEVRVSTSCVHVNYFNTDLISTSPYIISSSVKPEN